MDQEGLERTGWLRGDRSPGALSSGIADWNLKIQNKVQLAAYIAASGGGSMLNGIIAVFDHVPVLADAILDDAARTRPPARAPDRPSSTR
jgi:hypothetical protein